MDVSSFCQISGGLSCRDARFDDAFEFFPFGGQELGVEPGVDIINRQVKGFEYQKGCLIQGV